MEMSLASVISMVFFCICCGHTSSRNQFLCLYEKNKSSESKVKFRQARNRRRKLHETAKLAYAYKIKEPITSEKLGSRDFRRIVNIVLNKE